MIVSRRFLGMAGAVVFLMSLLAACSDQPATTEGLPAVGGADSTATEGIPVSPAASDTPLVGTAASPTPEGSTPAGIPTGTEETGGAIGAPEEEGVTVQPNIPSPVEPGLEPLIAQAKEDLAQRLSILVDQIEVLEARAVVWPDASLGCPQPGMKYRQVPMDGALIRLAVEGKVYEYHSGGGRGLFLCEQPLKLQKDTPPKIDLLKLTPPSPSY